MTSLGGGLDPELVAQIQALTASNPYSMPSSGGVPFTYGGASGSPGDTAGARSLQPAMTPDEGTSASDVFHAITGILSSPFRLVGAAKRGIEDAIGHPNAQARDARDAQYDMTLKYLLASNSIPDDVKRLLPGMQNSDRTGIIARQLSVNPTAVGRDNSVMPTPEPRRMGVMEWLTGEDQRQRARDEATVSAAMKLAGLDYGYRKDAADVRQKLYSGDAAHAGALKTDYETQLLYRYGDQKEQSQIGQARAAAASSYASAANSYASRDATQNRDAREGQYFDQVRLPGGLATNDQRAAESDLRLQTGRERLAQLQQAGPVDLQTKQARLAKAGGAPGSGADIPKDYVNLVKGYNVAVNQARDDYQKDWHLPTWLGGSGMSFDPSSIDAQFMVQRKPDGQPDWEGLLDRVRVKPTTAQPDTAGARPSASAPTVPDASATTAAPRPNGAERYKVFELLKKAQPGLDDGVISQRADLIAEAMPHLNFTDQNAFLDSGEAMGLSDDEMVLLWDSRNK